MNIVNESLKTERFSYDYPFVNKYIIENGDFIPSRYGDTREILDFKLKITNPYFRCVGNNERDINIFFLLAEALWIFKGEKDVEFLEIFNTKMKTFSDDGKVFHAPYGFRMRKHGVSSYDEINSTSPENNGHASQQIIDGFDQVEKALQMLDENPETRRVALQIWNAELDLGTDSVDIPCNDFVMLKIRDGKMITTIANRSNDLHWGLPTNVFQFSFVTEVMARILGVELGTQTHNSQSLHVYTSNPTTFNMYDNIQITNGKFEDLYDNAIPFKMDFNFDSIDVNLRLRQIDKMFSLVIDACRNKTELTEKQEESVKAFSNFLYLTYELLFLYIDYKFISDRSEKAKFEKLLQIIDIAELYPPLDILALAQNFFYSKLDNEVGEVIAEKLIQSAKL